MHPFEVTAWYLIAAVSAIKGRCYPLMAEAGVIKNAQHRLVTGLRHGLVVMRPMPLPKLRLMTPCIDVCTSVLSPKAAIGSPEEQSQKTERR